MQDLKYQEMTRSLTRKLQEFDRVLSSLKPIERHLLAAHIDDLNNTVRVGFTRTLLFTMALLPPAR